MGSDITFQIIMVFVLLVPILFLAYVSTRLVAGKTAKTMKSRNINIVESVSLGVDKKLHLVKAGNKYILIASSGKSIEFLTDVPLDESEVQETVQTGDNIFDFKKLFEKYIQGTISKKQTKTGLTKDEGSRDGLEKQPSIRNNLKRLRALNGSMEGQGRQDGDE